MKGLLEKISKKRFNSYKFADVIEIRTQKEDILSPSLEDIDRLLNIMFNDVEEFVVLTLPITKKNIRYIQSAHVEHGLTVQIGIEKNGKIELYEKICEKSRVVGIFYQFYKDGTVNDIDMYEPVKFK